MLRRLALLVLAAVTLFTAGCTSDDENKPNGPLPNAAELLKDAAEQAAKIKSTHFVVKVDGTVPGMAVKSIDGDLSAEGKTVAAKGTALLTAFGSQAEAKFVLVDGTLFLDLGTGKYQQIPEAQAKMVYDFSAVLDPERGVAKLITSIKDAKTVAAQEVAGAPAYKIDGTAPKEALTGLVPQADGDVKVSLWVTEKDHQPVQASATFPAKDGNKGGKLTVTMSKVNEPVTVEAPA